MNKSVFLILSALMILLCSCTGPNYRLTTTHSMSSWIINSNQPFPMNGDLNGGIHLPISRHSTLSIDVECIIDYARGEPTFGSQDERRLSLNPWGRYVFNF